MSQQQRSGGDRIVAGVDGWSSSQEALRWAVLTGAPWPFSPAGSGECPGPVPGIWPMPPAEPGDTERVTCSRSPASGPAAGEDPPFGQYGLVSSGPKRPIRLLLVDDGTTVRAAVGQTSGLKSGAVASSKGAGIDAVLEVVRTAAASPHS